MMRKTDLVEKTLQIFEHTNAPLTVPEILTYLKKQGLSPNKTTLYRMLDRLQNEHIIQEVLVQAGVSYYELQKEHHHHFSCNSCHRVSCLDVPDQKVHIHAVENELAGSGYEIENHQFALYGTCPDCKE